MTDVERADLEFVRSGAGRNEQTSSDENGRGDKHKDISDDGCHNSPTPIRALAGQGVENQSDANTAGARRDYGHGRT
jgi:hypothetical protein